MSYHFRVDGAKAPLMMKALKIDQGSHQRACIAAKAQKMLDPHQCAAYRFAALAAADPHSATPYATVLDECKHDIDRVTPADLGELCMRISGAYESSALMQKWRR